MTPARAGTIPLNALRMVVLPEPLPPRSAMIERAGTSNDTSRRTSVAPYQTLRCRAASMQLLPQIGLRDGWIAAHGIGPAFGDLTAVVEDGDAVRDLHHQPDHMLDHDQHDATLGADPPQK